MTLAAEEAKIGARQRAEIYAINKILKEAEIERFNQFIDQQLSPYYSCDPSVDDDSDSDNSCFPTAGARKPSSKTTGVRSSSRGKAINSAMLAATYQAKTQRSEPRVSVSGGVRKNVSSFGAV